MELLPLTQAKIPTRVWDYDVPIVTRGNTHYVYITDQIGEPFLYNELCHMLHTANDYDNFILHINTPGGIIDSAFMLIDAIKHTEAHVTAHLSGTVASAGTLVTLACDDIVVSDHISWMSHNYSGGNYGKGHELKARQEFVDAQLNKTFRELHAGFFTEEEIQSIIDGKDIWMGKDELLKRWQSKQSLSAATEVDDA